MNYMHMVLLFIPLALFVGAITGTSTPTPGPATTPTSSSAAKQRVDATGKPVPTLPPLPTNIPGNPQICRTNSSYTRCYMCDSQLGPKSYNVCMSDWDSLSEEVKKLHTVCCPLGYCGKVDYQFVNKTARKAAKNDGTYSKDNKKTHVILRVCADQDHINMLPKNENFADKWMDHNGCKTMKWFDGNRAKQCICKTDFCNSADISAKNSALAVFLMLVTVLMT